MEDNQNAINRKDKKENINSFNKFALVVNFVFYCFLVVITIANQAILKLDKIDKYYSNWDIAEIVMLFGILGVNLYMTFFEYKSFVSKLFKEFFIIY